MIVAQGREAVADGGFINVDNQRRIHIPHNVTIRRMQEHARGRLNSQATAQER